MNPEDKIRVFISSRCGGRYATVRVALKHLIDETGLAKAYLFENAPASSQNVQSSYLDKVDDCHLFILISDNEDDITPAVLSEFERAKTANKKILCFFCDETEKKESSLQQEITNTGICKYEVVHMFSDLVYKPYVAFVQDIIDFYIAKREVNIITEPRIENLDNQRISFINEEIVKELTSTRHELTYLLSQRFQNRDASLETSDIDAAFNRFLNVILCRNKYDDDDFSQTKSMILKLYNGHMRSVIEYRLEAIRFYYLEDIENCIELLKTAIRFIKSSKSIPTWVLNDVAIDLRNALFEQGSMDKNLYFDNQGQKILDESNEPLVFPILDRIDLDGLKETIKYYNSLLLESPYTSSIRNVNSLFERIGDYYCRALLFGSLSHLAMITHKCNETLLPLCLICNEPNYSFELIRNYILSGETNALDDFLRTYTQPSLVFAAFNLDELLSDICNLPTERKRTKSKMLVAKHFGYLLSDSSFDSLFEWIFSMSDNCIKNPIINDTCNIMIEAISKCIRRLDQNDVMTFVLKCFSSHQTIVIRRAVEIMYHINFSEINNAKQIECRDVLIGLYSDNDFERSVLRNATLCFCKNCSIQIDELEDIIKEKDLAFFNGDYSLEIYEKTKSELSEQVNRFVSTIEMRNESQGNNGYVCYLDDPYRTIWNILKSVNDEITFQDLKNVINACLSTIFAQKQGAMEKISAMSLLFNLKNKFSSFSDWKNIAKLISGERDKINEAFYTAIFDKTSRKMVSFATELMMMAYDCDNSFLVEMSELSTCDEYDIIECLKMINDYLSSSAINELLEKNVFPILQLCIGLSRHKERDIRYYATLIIINLTHSCCKRDALNQQVKIFNIGTQEIKIAIVSRLAQIDNDSSVVSYIKQKALADSNYLVRTLACKEIE